MSAGATSRTETTMLAQEGNEEDYKPPAGPPPSWKGPSPSGRASAYAAKLASDIQPQGWSVLNLGRHPHQPFGDDATYALYPAAWPAIESLFAASRAFFSLPDTEKQVFQTRDGSEEGYSRISGEKEFITLRRTSPQQCPKILRPAALEAWDTVFAVLHEALRGVEMSLHLPPTSLTRFSEPCLHLDSTVRATMLRLFRYENEAAKVVAEPHVDLGLLSLVVGDTPGLEAWDSRARVPERGQAGGWAPIERHFEQGMATLMVGRQLQYLTRERYTPGGHRVVSYGSGEPLIPRDLDDLYPSRGRRILQNLCFGGGDRVGKKKEKYRYSIVFVLRAHESVPVDYAALESPGPTAVRVPEVKPRFEESDKEARTAGELFRRIRAAHFNINTGIEQRDEQKKMILGIRQKTSSNDQIAARTRRPSLLNETS